MGRPPNTIARTKQIHASLGPLAAEFPDAAIPRQVFDAILMERYEIGDAQIANILKGGETLGYWLRRQGRNTSQGRGPGTVAFLGYGPGKAPFPST